MRDWWRGNITRRLVFAFSVLTVGAVVITAFLVRNALLNPLSSHSIVFGHALLSLVFSGFVLAILCGVLMSRSIKENLLSVVQVIDRISQGHQGVRLSQGWSGEYAELEQAVNHLADVFEKKIQDLSNHRTQLRAILASMVEGVVAVEKSGRIWAMNPALKDFFKTGRDVEGKPFIEVIRNNRLNQMIQDVLKDGRSRSDEIALTDREEWTLEVHAAPLYDEKQFAGVLLVLHDITRLRRLERIRRDFVANVSHELRTPLTTVKGFAETLREGAINDPKHRMDFVAAIEKQADRMIALVEDLLDLAAIESEKRPLVYEPFDLNELIEDVVSGLGTMARRKNVQLRIEPLAEPGIYADRSQLRQVLANLIDNAIKFNRDKGLVTISSEKDHESVTINISDTGLGIPSQDLARIFERFYRVDKARSRELGGTGLGLSIVKHIVEAHNGIVSVESALGKGSSFFVRLPQNLTTHA